MPNIDFSNLSVSFWNGHEYWLNRNAITVAIYIKKRKAKSRVKIISCARAFRFNKIYYETDFLKKYKKPKCFAKYYKGKIYILPITVALDRLKD